MVGGGVGWGEMAQWGKSEAGRSLLGGGQRGLVKQRLARVEYARALERKVCKRFIKLY